MSESQIRELGRELGEVDVGNRRTFDEVFRALRARRDEIRTKIRTLSLLKLDLREIERALLAMGKRRVGRPLASASRRLLDQWPAQTECGCTECAARLGVTKQRAQQLISNLYRAGYLERVRYGRYRLVQKPKEADPDA